MTLSDLDVSPHGFPPSYHDTAFIIDCEQLQDKMADPQIELRALNAEHYQPPQQEPPAQNNQPHPIIQSKQYLNWKRIGAVGQSAPLVLWAIVLLIHSFILHESVPWSKSAKHAFLSTSLPWLILVIPGYFITVSFGPREKYLGEDNETYGRRMVRRKAICHWASFFYIIFSFGICYLQVPSESSE